MSLTTWGRNKGKSSPSLNKGKDAAGGEKNSRGEEK